ncbi:PMCA-type calcium-translocating P-type ATPase [Glomus cerebriforme]|uniref:Calcium-transporting ATPase n=1 Tax=Glomus cerebriforme TaxID=658196 RepID=A0A397TAP1_9GLOM|nr:PMCA-type calcium-translocating P-type ATPase [Glomus cerebriforme]
MTPRENPQEGEPLLDEGSRNNEPFKFKPDQLGELIDPKSPDLLKKYGGTKKILEGLRVDPAVGLSSDEGLDTNRPKSKPFQDRQKVFGKNILPEVSQRSLLSLIWEAYQDKILILLSIAALISLIVGINEDYSSRHPEGEPRVGWVDGTAIIVAVAAVVLTNAINDYQKEKQFRKLNAKKEDRTVKLFRSGKEQQISVREINVGDILLLEPGDIVPVDGIYLTGHNLTCDESSATGESDPIKKGELEDDKDPFILSGSKVLDGVGRCVVIAVGTHSFFGKTMMALRDNEDEETPLQIKLDILAEQIAKLGVSASLIMLITLVIKYFVNAAVSDEFPDAETIFTRMISIVIQAITIVVVAVPEGLPMAVTLALAYATTQMLQDNNLVRVLSACETMGNATAVCSDKTGTLTQNRMVVVRGYIGQKKFEGENQIDEWKNKVSSLTYDILVQGIVINSSAFEDKDEDGKIVFVGSKTECALLEFSKLFGVDYRDIRAATKPIKVYPFSSERKTMTSVIKLSSAGSSHGKAPATNDYRVHVKGASEIVLNACTHYVDAQGKVQELDNNARQQFRLNIADFADGALRTICLAYRDITSGEFDQLDDNEPPIHDLICLGLVGIQDPLRPGVKESVEAFRKAGVFVRMITGDNIVTASAIARDAGILTKGGLAMNGPEFRKKSPEELKDIVPRLQVLARSSPTDKTIVVKWLKQSGDVVAVTGDGTNDGPALKLADVGFSMGIAGTEVAKEASSIILMDDNFNSIVKALKWGRAVNDSVRKFLQFQLTVNITAVIISFTSAVMSDESESILTAVQLLWVNLIMDTLAALALATEPPTDDLLDRYPTSKKASLISYRMWKMIIGQSIFQIAINLSLLHLGPAIFHLSDSKDDVVVLRTLVFNTFVFLQVFNEINCRRIDDDLNVFKNIFHNPIFIIVQIVVILGQILIVEFGGVAFGTVRLSWYQWLVTVLIGFLSLPIGFIIRLIPNNCIPERVLNEEHVPIISQAKMQFGSAIEDIKTQNKIIAALGRGKKPVKAKSIVENIRRHRK